MKNEFPDGRHIVNSEANTNDYKIDECFTSNMIPDFSTSFDRMLSSTCPFETFGEELDVD